MSLSPDQLSTTLDRLRRMRHAKAMTAPKVDPGGSLVPLLEVSAEVCALDVAIKGLEQPRTRVRREAGPMTLAEHAEALGAASRELAAAIDRQSKPEPGWNLGPWSRHVAKDVAAARAKRDAVAAEYRAAVVAFKRALDGRSPSWLAEKGLQGHD